MILSIGIVGLWTRKNKLPETICIVINQIVLLKARKKTLKGQFVLF